MSQKTFEKLTALLDANQASYRVVEHPTAGKSEEVAKIRGTQIGQGAKALACVVKKKSGKQYVLAVLPADQQADLTLLATNLGGVRASLISPVEVFILSYCWLSILFYLNVMTNWHLMPVRWSVPLF